MRRLTEWSVKMLFDDKNGLKAAEDRYPGGTRAVQYYGPVLFKMMQDNPGYFTTQMGVEAVEQSSYKRVNERTIKLYMSLVVTYVNMSALPLRIERRNLGNKYWYVMLGCNNS